jgi:hypothetical protein
MSLVYARFKASHQGEKRRDHEGMPTRDQINSELGKPTTVLRVVIAHPEEVLRSMHSLENNPVTSVRWGGVNKVNMQ